MKPNIRTHPILIASLLVLIPWCSRAAEGDTLWSRYFGNEFFEVGWALCPTGDGGCVLAGTTEHEYAGPQNMYAVRVNADGDTLWSREYGDDMFEAARAICPTEDGGFVLVGNTNSFTYWADMYLVRIDAAGTPAWSRHYGGDMYETAYAVCPAGDGGFVAAGNTGSFAGGCLYVLKVTGAGAASWSRNYSGNNIAEARGIMPSGDGGFVVAGYVQQPDDRGDDVYVLRLNSVGDTLWTRTFGGTGMERATSVCASGDGGYMVAGYTSSFGAGSWDMYLVKVSAAGNQVWARTYGRSLGEQANAICASGDGGFLLAGYTDQTASGFPNMYLVKIAATGDTLWTRQYGEYYEENAWAVGVSDGRILLGGHGAPPGEMFADMCLLRLSGVATGVAPDARVRTPAAIVIRPARPNPSRGVTTIEFELPTAGCARWEILDARGRRVAGSAWASLPAGAHRIDWDGSGMPAGIYFARVTAGATTRVQRLALLR